MSTNFQYRLQQLETVPPAESWSLISGRLDEEYDLEDINVSQKMLDLEASPPFGAWENVLLALPDLNQVGRSLPVQPEARRGATIIPLKLQRVAAVALLCIGISVLYLMTNRDPQTARLSRVLESVTQEAGMLPRTPRPAAVAPPVPNTVAPATTASLNGRSFRTNVRQRINAELQNTQAAYQQDQANEVHTNNLRYAAVIPSELANASEDINIPTEPIRDQQGNIIMDEQLVSTPDMNYVMVTGPNGEQTKISKKFLHALGYMNARSSDEDYMGITLHEASLWKWLFQEWRQKLLTQPSFIPSSSNFLDIMELKEILHENF